MGRGLDTDKKGGSPSRRGNSNNLFPHIDFSKGVNLDDLDKDIDNRIFADAASTVDRRQETGKILVFMGRDLTSDYLSRAQGSDAGEILEDLEARAIREKDLAPLVDFIDEMKKAGSDNSLTKPFFLDDAFAIWDNYRITSYLLGKDAAEEGVYQDLLSWFKDPQKHLGDVNKTMEPYLTKLLEDLSLQGDDYQNFGSDGYSEEDRKEILADLKSYRKSNLPNLEAAATGKVLAPLVDKINKRYSDENAGKHVLNIPGMHREPANEDDLAGFARCTHTLRGDEFTTDLSVDQLAGLWSAYSVRAYTGGSSEGSVAVENVLDSILPKDGFTPEERDAAMHTSLHHLHLNLDPPGLKLWERGQKAGEFGFTSIDFSVLYTKKEIDFIDQQFKKNS